jgi:hypothetical protein
MPGLSNEAADLPLQFEQVRNFAGGEDSFSDPIELGANQSQHLVNILVRDKLKIRTRPGADPLGAAALTNPAAPVKGALFYSTPATSQLLAASGGKIFKWNGAAWAQVMGWLPASANVFVEMAQGVDKVLLSDGVGKMQSYDGAAFTDLGNTDVDPPVGATILTFHTGRMFASGQATNPDTIYVSNRLDFGSGQWNKTTRSFRVGGGEGDAIVGMASMPFYQLAVMKENSIWLTQTDPRLEPANFSATQASDVVSDGLGLVGKKAWCRYGNDLLFFSQDGVRSLQKMVAATGQFELSAPISVPIQPYIDRINPNFQHLIVAKKYREFAFFAVPLDDSQFNNAVLVWNGRLGRWLGVWQGWTPSCWELTRFNRIQRLVFGDNGGFVNQWKDLNDSEADATYQDNGTDYATKYWSRSMTFGDLDAPKTAFNAKTRFNAGNATLTFTAVGNDAELNSFSKSIAPSGDVLGTGVLPFLLATEQPTLIPFSLRGLPSFNELFLKIESTGGWWELRNLTVGARVRPLKRK